MELITARKLSLVQGNIFTGMCQSFCPGGEGGLFMMSLPVWLPGPCSFCGSLSLVPCSFEGSLSSGGLCPGEISVQRGVSVWGVSLSRVSLYRGISVRSGKSPDRDPPYGEEWVVRILLECILVSK